MRIALLVPGGVSRDGEYRVIPAILWLLSRLSSRHDVQVVVPNQEPVEGRWELCGASVHNVVGRHWQARAASKVLALHRERPFDVVHAMWARGPGEAGLLAARWTRVPLTVHVAGGELVWLPDIEFGARRWRRTLAGLVLRRADLVTAASAPMLELAARAGVVAERVALGADLGLWLPDAPRRREQGRPLRLVSVGSLTPVKDHATLIEAIAILRGRGRDVVADLVGEDTSGGTVQRLTAELDVRPHVTFHGFLPNRSAAAVVRASDVLVVTSVHEAGPVAMMEAGAVGVPVVGTGVGHVREWSPEAAVSVPLRDAHALADALEFLDDDESRRLDLARRAQEIAVREDADWTAGRFEEIYHRVVGERRAR